MSALPNRAGSHSQSGSYGQTSTSEVASGWESDGYDFAHQNSEWQVIELANNRVSLYSTLKKYNVRLEEQYSRTGWDHKGQCPFPDHRDLRPSFGYNSVKDCFYCFGCKRSGRTVEFISFIDNKDKIVVAKNIVGKVTPEELFAASEGQFDRNKLKNILFEYADTLRKFKNEYDYSATALKYADDVTWNLDVYLAKHARNNTMIFSEMEIRIKKIKEQLGLFEE